MFRATRIMLGCLALLAGCRPEAPQQVPQPTPAAAQQTRPAEHRDTDAVYFRETPSADGKFAEQERKSVRYPSLHDDSSLQSTAKASAELQGVIWC